MFLGEIATSSGTISLRFKKHLVFTEVFEKRFESRCS